MKRIISSKEGSSSSSVSVYKSKKQKIYTNLFLIKTSAVKINNLKENVILQGKSEILLKSRLYKNSDRSLELSSLNDEKERGEEGREIDEDNEDHYNRACFIYNKLIRERTNQKLTLDYIMKNQRNFKSGHDRIKIIKFILDNIPNPQSVDGSLYTRFSHQVDFHDAIIRSALPLIYKQEWEKNSEKIMKQFNMKTHYVETIICSARRVGKTIAIVMIAVAFLLACPNIKIGIFSTTRNTSNLLREVVIKILQIMVPQYIVKNNSEITILKIDKMDERSIATNTSVVKV